MNLATPQLSGINLNLFPVLEALLRVGSVTGAAEELGVSQSAVSHSLRELRAVMGDPLFVRAGQRLQPTARAVALRTDVRRALETLSNAVAFVPSFDPSTSQRRFTLSTADEVATTLLPALIGRLARLAPEIRLEVQGRSPARDAENLHQGSLDILFSPKPARASGLRVDKLYTDTFSCIVRDDHPVIGARMTRKQFLAAKHVLVTPEGGGPGIVDNILSQAGETRRLYTTTRFFMAAPEIVAQSDLVATIPTRLARSQERRLGIRLLRPPFQIPPFSVYRLTSKVRSGDPALAWLLEVIDQTTAALAQKLPDGP